jgi:hypothetical protein
MIKFIIIFLAAISVRAELPQTFVKAIHQVETGGRTGKIVGDNGKSLGALQIHKAYWQDATEFNKNIKGKYEDCIGLKYSALIMNAYLLRYCPKEVKAQDFEAMARCHNSGPNFRVKKKLTDNYWNKVKKHLN